MSYKRVDRPWGSYQTVHMVDNTYQVKTITVKPLQKLSLQYHHQRSEHWVVTRGSIKAQVGDDFHNLHANQSIYIPKGAKHRIINETETDAELIEVQVGDYLGEDDIVRLEDVYGRVSE